MDFERFREAGRHFHSKQARDFSACDQAIARLRDARVLCEEGINAFFDAAEAGKPDVYVANNFEVRNERQLTVFYGARPVRGGILCGPRAHIFVSPDGRTLLATESGWVRSRIPFEQLVENGELPAVEWEAELTRWLCTFLATAEQEYASLLG